MICFFIYDCIYVNSAFSSILFYEFNIVHTVYTNKKEDRTRKSIEKESVCAML